MITPNQVKSPPTPHTTGTCVDAENEAGSRALQTQVPRPSLISGYDRRSTEKMRKILVTGNAGSGKSTLARRIASLLNIPYHGLDRIVWQPGWKKTPQDEKERLMQEVIGKDSWVIDGVSFTVQAKADVVVFLDVPRRVSFWRVLKRNWRYLFRSRPELPEGCPEALIIPTLCKIIWNFPSRVRPGILKRIKHDHVQKFFHVKTNADIKNLLTILEERMAEQNAALNCARLAPPW